MQQSRSVAWFFESMLWADVSGVRIYLMHERGRMCTTLLLWVTAGSRA